MSKYDVCVFGGCSIDKMYYQNTDTSYNSIPNILIPGGKGANQAVAASRAGADTVIITKLGKDKTGEKILNELAYNRINLRAVEMIEGLTNDSADIYINIKDKDNDIHRHNGAIDSFTIDMIEKNADILLDSKVIVCQLKCPKEVTEALIEFCHVNEKILILTPCRPQKLVITDEKNKELIDKISLITCNESECKTIFNTDNIEECVKQYPNKLIVTLGGQGLMYYNGEDIVKLAAVEVENVVDTTGAGDTFNGNLACFISEGMELRHAIRRAMYASAIKIQSKTAQAGMPYKHELEKFIEEHRNKEFEYKEELNYILSIIKKVFKEDIKVEISRKADGSFVTTKDVAIEDDLIKKILEKFPDDSFVSEERHKDGIIVDRTWIIDPIDGTNHFIKDTDFYSVQLAFYDKGQTQFSVMYFPKKDKLYYAFKNGGAYENNNKISIRKPRPVDENVVEFSGTIYKAFEEKEYYLKKLMHNVLDFRFLNSASLAFADLATGKTDALIISSHKPWDVMPGMLLCKEAGILKQKLDFENKLTLYYTNPKILEILFKK